MTSLEVILINILTMCFEGMRIDLDKWNLTYDPLDK